MRVSYTANKTNTDNKCFRKINTGKVNIGPIAAETGELIMENKEMVAASNKG